MNILLLGSGGREHALAWKIAASPLTDRLYCAPGNAGIAREAECVALDIADHAAIIAFCKANKIDFVVVGPEAPLVAGLVDDLEAAGFKTFGPNKLAARLEGSKGFTKDLCRANHIPTAAYERFTSPAPAKDYLGKQGAPIVVKAEGLDARRFQVVHHAGAERALRPDHHEVDLVGLAERDDRGVVGDIERHAFGLARNAGVAGRAIEPVGERACRNFPGQRVFAPAGTEEEDVHWRTALARGLGPAEPSTHSVHNPPRRGAAGVVCYPP